MMMTRKDYVAIAALIKHQRESAERDDIQLGVEYIADSLAHFFKTDNPRFDRERFLKACGVQS